MAILCGIVHARGVARILLWIVGSLQLVVFILVWVVAEFVADGVEITVERERRCLYVAKK